MHMYSNPDLIQLINTSSILNFVIHFVIHRPTLTSTLNQNDDVEDYNEQAHWNCINIASNEENLYAAI